MSFSAIAGLATVAVLVFGGLSVVNVISDRVYRARVALFSAAQGRIDDPSTSAADRRIYTALLDNAQTFGAGWIVPRALLRTLTRFVRGSKLVESGQMDLTDQDRIFGLFALSAVCSNPLALLISIPLVVVLLGVGLARHQRPRATFKADARDVASVSLSLCMA